MGLLPHSKPCWGYKPVYWCTATSGFTPRACWGSNCATGVQGMVGWGQLCRIPVPCPALRWVQSISKAAAALRALQGAHWAAGSCFPEYAKLFMCFPSMMWEGSRCLAVALSGAMGWGPMPMPCSPTSWCTATVLQHPHGVIPP